jgi:type 1 glutamine amidotransferase
MLDNLKMQTLFKAFMLVAVLTSCVNANDDRWVVYEPAEGSANGKHIVLLAGDEEYRSEEAMPMLGKILSQHHGFKCTVLFSQDPDTGVIDPNNQTNIPGIESLNNADLMIVFFRFRELPDADMKIFDEYVRSGKPIIALRTATHAFNYTRNRDSEFAHYSFNANNKWKDGFGREILGETWVNHHGHHGQQSTRGVINVEHADHPIVKGVTDIWGPTDVYGVRNLPDDADVLVQGQVLEGMNPSDKAVEGKQNEPMMPLIWTRNYQLDNGKTSRIVCSTIGASVDFNSEGLRRTLVNSCYWALGMEDKIPAKSNVDIIGTFKPTMFGFNKFKKDVKPADHRIQQERE